MVIVWKNWNGKMININFPYSFYFFRLTKLAIKTMFDVTSKFPGKTGNVIFLLTDWNNGGCLRAYFRYKLNEKKNSTDGNKHNRRCRPRNKKSNFHLIRNQFPF